MRDNIDVQVSEMRDILRKANSKVLDEYDEFSGTLSVMSTNKKPPSTPSSSSQQQFYPSSSNVAVAVTSNIQVPTQTRQDNFHSKYSSLDCAKMLERMSAELSELDSDLVKQNRVAISSKTKLSLLEDKFRYVVNIRTSLGKLSAQLYSMYQEKCIKQVEIDVWENSYIKLKEIHMSKINSDTVEKIFYNIDITSPSSSSSSLSLNSSKFPNSSEMNLSNTVFSNFSDSRKSGKLENRFHQLNQLRSFNLVFFVYSI